MSAADDAAQQNDESIAVAHGAEGHGASQAPPPEDDAMPTGVGGHGGELHDEDEDEAEEDEDEEEDEPKLKYDKLTGRLASVYRNGDSSSSFTVAGNKMVIGTHNGNIHVLALPAMQPLRTYHAHSATITCCSVSPTPPPPTIVRRADGSGNTLLSPQAAQGRGSTPSKSATPSSPKTSRQTGQQHAVANTPDNAIYIATSSLDGHVCISSLIDPKDVQLRNFARPVNTVALSPEYKSDRAYLSGGKAGHLILTVGGKAGVSSDANTNSAAAAASGWLGSIGLGTSSGKDSILHQGEGIISTIKWSLSGKWVVWVNEEGIKIMRSNLRLNSEHSEDAWKRIAHAARPNRSHWEEMAGVWKARARWIDEQTLESEEVEETTSGANGTATSATPKKRTKTIEKLVVGWGDQAWVLVIHEGGTASSGQNAGKRQVGSAEIVHKLVFRDCVVSGLSLYSPSFLAILAYRTRDDNDRPLSSAKPASDSSRRGRAHKHTGIAPQLRLVNVNDGEELDVDELPMSRFETLSAQDYDFETLWIPPTISEKTVKESKGALEGLWEVSGGYYASKMFSSGASMLSQGSSGVDDEGRILPTKGRSGSYDVTPTESKKIMSEAHQLLIESGLKLFIQSPYDCVLAVKRQSSDHLEWLLKQQQYAKAWALLDKHPEIIDRSTSDLRSISSGIAESPSKTQQSLADFLAIDDSSSSSNAGHKVDISVATREKRHIGELWLAQLVASKHWTEAGEIAGKVLDGSTRWEHWVLYFAQADHFDEITPFVPRKVIHPAIPSLVYEVILGHYIVTSPARVGALLDEWEEGVFEASAVVTAIEGRLENGDVKQGSEDWRALLDALGQLYLSLSRPRDALRCYIRTSNADRAFALIQEEKLADALREDIPAFVTLKVSKQQMRNAPLEELQEASEQAVKLLVDEAHRGTITTGSVLRQLQEKGPNYQPFLFFYLRTLWRGTDGERAGTISRSKFKSINDEGHAMVEDHADLAVEMFAEYDRQILSDFLQSSEVYDYNKAAAICEQRHYIAELVLVLNRMGQIKRALWLIIGELGDVAQAISFVRQNPDMWDDLLQYGMDKPRFIRGLLAEVGTSVDPVKLIKRIPEGLEVDGLKDSVMKLVQGWEVQLEVSKGVERVLRGEVLAGMDVLRQGQKKGLRFEVVHETPTDVDLSVVAPPIEATEEAEHLVPDRLRLGSVKPGHCVGCDEVFHEEETQPLLGFACGHVYHLSCLLRDNGATSDPDTFEQVMNQLGYDTLGGGSGEEYSSRSVGAKVAHAHIIRSMVKGGCPLCPVLTGD